MTGKKQRKQYVKPTTWAVTMEQSPLMAGSGGGAGGGGGGGGGGGAKSYNGSFDDSDDPDNTPIYNDNK